MRSGAEMHVIFCYDVGCTRRHSVSHTRTLYTSVFRSDSPADIDESDTLLKVTRLNACQCYGLPNY